MKTYLASQVILARQLKPGDVMHCGQLSGQCVLWKCVAVDPDGKSAVIDVGGSRLRMSSRDIRSGLPMYYADECPMCSINSPLPAIEAAEVEPNYTVMQLEAADVASTLSGVDNYRVRGAKQGGAAMSSEKAYYRKVASDLAERVLRASTAAERG